MHMQYSFGSVKYAVIVGVTVKCADSKLCRQVCV